MALSDLKFPSKPVSDGLFAVRGLSLSDIGALYRDHGTTLAALFGGVSMDESFDGSVLLKDLISTAPDLVADMIARVAGDRTRWDDERQAARDLPLDVQIEALEAIAVLTFERSGGPKKVWETVMRMIAGATTLAASMGGSGQSEGK